MIINGSTLSDTEYRHMVEFVTFRLRDIDRKELVAILPNGGTNLFSFLVSSAMQAKEGSYICLNKQGDPICVGGICEIRPGIGNVWLWASPSFISHRLEITRFIRKNVQDALDNNFHRLQCVTAAFHSNSKAWLKAAGFRQEGTLDGFGNNKENFIQFGISR